VFVPQYPLSYFLTVFLQIGSEGRGAAPAGPTSSACYPRYSSSIDTQGIKIDGLSRQELINQSSRSV
jgi:hypothetical protein